MNTQPLKIVRIFISSPGDVKEEREQACRVVKNLQRRERDVKLETLLWEDLPLPSTATFQESIDILLQKKPVDIAIFILWSRLGTPLGPQITKADGGSYHSGTEREFELMLAAHERSGEEKRPSIFSYLRDDEPGLKERMNRTPVAKWSEAIEQSLRAGQFIREHFRDEQGRNLRAYTTYGKPIAFAQRLESHLRGALSEMLGVDFTTGWEGEPYRGLEYFDVEHGPIFRGRDEEICDVLERLQGRVQAKCASVVIVGASGSGKSSLARAGVAAALKQYSYAHGVKEWRSASLIPGRAAPDLMLRLVRTIAEAFPEQKHPESELEDLTAALRENATETIVRAILNPLLGSPPPEDQGEVRLLLIVDQLEELWTDARVTVAVREQFLRALLAIARSGRISVLMTLRSDFYPEAQQLETFLALKEGLGQVDLLPPGAEVLHQLIAEPARLSGLRFEQDPKTGKALDQTLAKAAVGGRVALPLLQYALHELYQKRDARQNLLTFAAYDELGGLEGAIGRRAEKIVEALPENVRATLPEMARQLVVLHEGSEELFTSARAPLAQLATTPQRRALIDALVEARLLVLDQTESSATVGLAHESLLLHWPRLKKLLEDDREFHRVRQRVRAAAHRWRDENKIADFLLPPGKPLAEGRDLLLRRRSDLDQESIEFVTRSIEQDEATRNTRRALLVGASITILLLSGVLSVVFYLQKSHADGLRVRAEKGEELAKENMALVRVKLASQSWTTAEIGRTRKFLEETPKDRRDWEWRYVKALCDRNRLTMEVGKPTNTVQFSPDGTSLAGSWTAPKPARNVLEEAANSRPLELLLSSGIGGEAEEGGAGIWNSATGKRFLELKHPDGPTLASEFVTLKGDGAPSGLHLATVSRLDGLFSRRIVFQEGVGEPLDYVLQLWKSGGTAPVHSQKLRGHFVSVRRDGRVAVATNLGDKTKKGSLSAQVVSGIDPFRSTRVEFRVYDLGANGAMVASFDVAGAGVTSLLFHPMESQLISSHQDGAMHVWDIDSRKLRATLPVESTSAKLVALSEDGSTVALTRKPLGDEQSSLEVWDLVAQIPRSTIQTDIEATQFALDKNGLQLAAGAWDNTVRVWNTSTGKETHIFRGHADLVTDVAFHPQDAVLASCGKEGVMKLWDLQVRDQRATILDAPGKWIKKLALPDVGPFVALVREGGAVELWNAMTGKRELEVLKGAFAAIDCRGEILATGEEKNLILRRLGSEGESILRCSGHEHDVEAAAFSQDGERIVSIDAKGKWIVWRTSDGNQEVQIPGMAGDSSSNFGASFSPDRKYVFGYRPNVNSLFFWELNPTQSGKDNSVSYPHSEMLAAAGMSEDGKRIVALSGWGNGKPAQLSVWEPGNEKPLFSHLVSAGSVYGAAISPNGKRLFTAISGKGVQVWDVDAGLEILTLTDFGEVAHELALSASGQRLMGVNAKTGTIKIWDASPE